MMIFGDWFENEVWANGEDGDHLTMEHEDGDWWLEDQNGNQYDIPDGLMNNNDIDISGPDTNSDFDYSDPPEPDNIESSDAIPYFKAKIYHKICGTIWEKSIWEILIRVHMALENIIAQNA